MPLVTYTSTGFPQHLGNDLQGVNTLSCTWEDIVWAAVTVGKAEHFHLLRFGIYSRMEMIFRASLIFANLKQNNGSVTCRTDAFNFLDPTEKGAVSYFLGMTSAKLLAERYLSVPWLMHLDVYWAELNPVLAPGKSKPDLIGKDLAGNWIILEAKGRSSAYIGEALTKAKSQTEKLQSVNGTDPHLRVALVCYFPDQEFRIEWNDPEDFDKDAESIDLDEGSFLSAYYRPFVSLIRDRDIDTNTITQGERNFNVVRIDEADLAVGLDVYVLQKLQEAQYTELKAYLKRSSTTLSSRDGQRTKIGIDGVLVQLGERWDSTKMTREPHERVSVAL